MLLMARQCRSMRAHAARRPNVFVLAPSPLLQDVCRGKRRGDPVTAGWTLRRRRLRVGKWASGINLGIKLAARRAAYLELALAS